MHALIDARAYTPAEQRRFAELSGDFNPIHLDPVAARRELFGVVVVHGIHGLLRALDAHLARLRERGLEGVALRRLRVKFPNPASLEQPVQTFVVEEAQTRAKLQACQGALAVLAADVAWSDATSGPAGPELAPAAPAGARREPRDPAFAELAGRKGRVDLYAARDAVAAAFPALAAGLPLCAIAELLALTRLVGMECPGLHSIFSGFEVAFEPPAAETAGLEWEVTATDPRFSLVKLALRGPSMRGVADAFRRPEPQRQPDMADVRERVRAGEFAGQCALVVGGSRGLGEVTARIVAAGGGLAFVTYHRGREDAEALAAEIREAGGACEPLACDVSDPGPAVESLRGKGVAPSHVYYFASPKIFVSKGSDFDPRLFRSFAACYVDGLAALHRALRAAWSGPLAVFYPSSTALDEPVRNLAEYSASKAAGEALCAQLERFDRELRVLVRRLPRIATDQTLTLSPYPAENALDIMLPLVRSMSAGATSTSTSESG